MLFTKKKTAMPTADEALPGRQEEMQVPERHFVLDTPLRPPWPHGTETVQLGMGCFWGAERIFWQMDGVYTTAAGYGGGITANPTYEEVCSGRTGHNEIVLVVFDPAMVSFETLLAAFWENHDPTQGMRQGNDVGTQYRSGIYVTTDGQREIAKRSRDRYQELLTGSGYGQISTEVVDAGPFYYAESYHQQYLAKNPNGYCNHGFCQIAYSAPDQR
ncbi:MAG: peptide-methionine (S)-S-oxide reductase MsrA [Acidimicrobiia bacterium]|nr:peptide-methionine (S)-S-oxide reductase MsrA [Acidimicrobiia bacterium]